MQYKLQTFIKENETVSTYDLVKQLTTKRGNTVRHSDLMIKIDKIINELNCSDLLKNRKTVLQYFTE